MFTCFLQGCNGITLPTDVSSIGTNVYADFPDQTSKWCSNSADDWYFLISCSDLTPGAILVLVFNCCLARIALEAAYLALIAAACLGCSSTSGTCWVELRLCCESSVCGTTASLVEGAPIAAVTSHLAPGGATPAKACTTSGSSYPSMGTGPDTFFCKILLFLLWAPVLPLPFPP